jgi:predicted DNA-binding transcriptional regulator AlpA
MTPTRTQQLVSATEAGPERPGAATAASKRRGHHSPAPRSAAVTINESTSKVTELRPLLSVDEVATILGVPKATLYRWHSVTTPSARVGPRAFRVGRYLRYSLEDLRAYIDELRGSAS